MIYKFTDTAKRATPGTLPGEALFINGQAIENLIEGYRTLYVKGRESMSAEINLAEQGRADGGGFNYKRYPERVLTIGFQIIAKTNEEYRAKFNALGGILNCEQAELIFNDELDKYFVGTPGEISEIEGGSNKVTGEFNIVCADPFKYSVEEKTLEINTVRSRGDTKFLYNGTVPVYPKVVGLLTGATGGDVIETASWFEYFKLNDNVLTFEGGEQETEKLAELSIPSNSGSSGGWTTYSQEETFDDNYPFAMAHGNFVYTNTDVTNCYRFIARLNMGGGSVNVSPSIEIYRNYSDRVPHAELRFKIGDNIVYSKTIDDLGGVDYPFRISYGASRVRAIQLGYLPYSVTFQFGDLIYTYKSSVDYAASDLILHPEYYAVNGAYIEYGKHYESTSNVERTGSMFVINTTVNYMSNPFLYGVPHEVDPKEANFYIDGLLTPYVNNPANDWTAFKIVPGENIAFASSYGIASGYFHATLKYREVFV